MVVDLRVPTLKLLPCFVGPFLILRKVSPVAYVLDLSSGMHICKVFYVSLLKSLVCNCYTSSPSSHQCGQL